MRERTEEDYCVDEETFDLQGLMDAIDLVVDCIPATRKAIAEALAADGDSGSWVGVGGYMDEARGACFRKAAKILTLGPTQSIRES